MAWLIAKQPSEVEAELVVNGSEIDYGTADITLPNSVITPAADSLGEALITASNDEPATSENDWLTDELLELVFG